MRCTERQKQKAKGFNSKVKLIIGGPCGPGGVYKTCFVVGRKAIKLRSDSPFLSVPCESQQLSVFLALLLFIGAALWTTPTDSACRQNLL